VRIVEDTKACRIAASLRTGLQISLTKATTLDEDAICKSDQLGEGERRNRASTYLEACSHRRAWGCAGREDVA
jgi:hypothetical protein